MKNPKLILKPIFIYFAVLIWLNVSLHKAKCDTSDMDVTRKIKAVKDKIFKDYDKLIRPTTEHLNTTQVNTVLIPKRIASLDEEVGIFSLDSLMLLRWNDLRLQWNRSDYNDVLQFHKDLIWTPDITVLNSHSARVDPTSDIQVLIYPQGSVIWVPPIYTQTSCPSLTQADYPTDEVECEVLMGSWGYDGWEVDFLPDSKMYFDGFKNIHPRWELITSKAETEKLVRYYDCCPEPYHSMSFRFPLKRRPVPEIEATRIPCILIMVLTLSFYWLPRESPKKLLLGVFLFLSLNVLSLYVAGSTRNPLAVLLGVSFIRTTLLIGVTTILLQVFIVFKVASFVGPSRPPVVVTNLLTGPLGKYLLLRSPFSEDKQPLDLAILNEDSTTTEVFSLKDEWILLATALDRVFFLIMVMATICVHHL